MKKKDSDKNMKTLGFIAHIAGLASFIYLISERVLGYNIDVIVVVGLALGTIIFWGRKVIRVLIARIDASDRGLISRIDASDRDLISRIDRLETDVKKIKESLPQDKSKTP